MIRAFGASLVALAAMVVPVLAQGYTEDQKAVIIAAMVANGCSIDEEGAERLLPPLGIGKIVFAAVVTDMEVAGQVTWSDETETLTLAPELCP